VTLPRRWQNESRSRWSLVHVLLCWDGRSIDFHRAITLVESLQHLQVLCYLCKYTTLSVAQRYSATAQIFAARLQNHLTARGFSMVRSIRSVLYCLPSAPPLANNGVLCSFLSFVDIFWGGDWQWSCWLDLLHYAGAHPAWWLATQTAAGRLALARRQVCQYQNGYLSTR
jgi:hypothetical protein